MVPGYHFRHRVTVYRLASGQNVDPDFGEVDGTKQYQLVGTFRAYVRFHSDEERVISQTGERLEGDGKILFRLQDLNGQTIKNGDRLLINGEYAYEALTPTPRSPRLGRYLTLEVAFRRWKTAPESGSGDLMASLTVL